MIDRNHTLPIKRQAELLSIGRSTVYYRPRPGGVTRSLRLDPHGKTLSSVMLGIELPDD